MSTNSPRRKRLTAAQRRAAILEAAQAVFAEHGFHAASIDDIARSAGISKALIYEHFSSKQELYASLLDQEADELFARLASAVSLVEGPGAPRLATGLDAFFGFVEERRDAWRMLFRENQDREAAARLNRVVAQVTEVVAALIAQDPGSRAMPQDEAQRGQAIRMLAQLLVGSVQSIANWWDDHRDVPRERVVEVVMDFAWIGLDGLSEGRRWTDESPKPRRKRSSADTSSKDASSKPRGRRSSEDASSEDASSKPRGRRSSEDASSEDASSKPRGRRRSSRRR